MKKKSCGNGGAVESVEIQNQDFPSFHRSLEISPTNARFPHSHSSDDEAVEKWKTKSRFPTFPQPSLLRLRKAKHGRLRRLRTGTFLSR